MPRFEVIPPPVEERLERGIRAQLTLLAGAVRRTLASVHTNRSHKMDHLNRVLADESFLKQAASLLLPSSLPGFLLTCSIALALARHVVVHILARRAVRSCGHEKLS